MRVQTKLTLTFLALALFPLATIGFLTFSVGEQALLDSLGASFQYGAAQAIDKVDRELFDVQERVRTWVQLELMQEVVTGDVDGRISSFLMAVGRDSRQFAGIEVMDPEGRIVASSVPDLIGLDASRDQGFLAASRGRRVVRDAERDKRLDAWVVSFCEPIPAHFDDHGVAGVLCARWNVRELQTMTEGGGPGDRPEPGVATLVLRSDGLELSAPDLGDTPGPHPGRLGVARLAARGREGHAVEEFDDGVTRLVGYSPSRGHSGFEGLGWSALVTQDFEQASAPIQRLKLVFGGAGAVTAAAVVILSLVIGHRLAAPLVRMAEAASRVARGDFGQRVDFRSADEVGTLAEAFDRMTGELQQQREQLVADVRRRERAERDATAAKESAERAEEQIRASLAEKEALLKEVHHRVKNNLQVVVSLLRLQADHIKDPGALDVFRDSESRIRSMALTHEMLYRSRELSRIDVADYLRTLARDLLTTYGGEASAVTLEVDVQPIPLSMDDAIHCGLLVTELLSNALKHAYPGGRSGEIRVGLREEGGDGYLLTVADDGVGLPADLELDAAGETLGLQLVSTLAAQLDGEVRVERAGGTTFEVRFRASEAGES